MFTRARRCPPWRLDKLTRALPLDAREPSRLAFERLVNRRDRHPPAGPLGSQHCLDLRRGRARLLPMQLQEPGVAGLGLRVAGVRPSLSGSPPEGTPRVAVPRQPPGRSRALCPTRLAVKALRPVVESAAAPRAELSPIGPATRDLHHLPTPAALTLQHHAAGLVPPAAAPRAKLPVACPLCQRRGPPVKSRVAALAGPRHLGPLADTAAGVRAIVAAPVAQLRRLARAGGGTPGSSAGQHDAPAVGAPTARPRAIRANPGARGHGPRVATTLEGVEHRRAALRIPVASRRAVRVPVAHQVRLGARHQCRTAVARTGGLPAPLAGQALAGRRAVLPSPSRLLGRRHSARRVATTRAATEALRDHDWRVHTVIIRARWTN
jgi:hypothetical protein